MKRHVSPDNGDRCLLPGWRHGDKTTTPSKGWCLQCLRRGGGTVAERHLFACASRVTCAARRAGQCGRDKEEQMAKKLIVNNLDRDNPDLSPIRDRRTINKMLTLVKAWTQEARHLEFCRFAFATSGGGEARRLQWALYRIGCVRGLLGAEVVEKAVDEATQDFGKTIDPRVWEIFMRAYQDEARQKLDRRDSEPGKPPW
jgi:hypothetical protein